MKNVILRGEHAAVISPCDSDMICEFCGTPFNNVDFSKNIVIIICSNCGRKWAATPVNWAVVPISSIIAQLHHSEVKSPDVTTIQEPEPPVLSEPVDTVTPLIEHPVPLVGKLYPNSDGTFRPLQVTGSTPSCIQDQKKPAAKVTVAPPVLDQSSFCTKCGQELVRCGCIKTSAVNTSASGSPMAEVKEIATTPAPSTMPTDQSSSNESKKPECVDIPDNECDSYESCTDCPAY